MQPAILALDFDGVVCNGLREYFQTSQRAYFLIWPEENLDLMPYAQRFYHLRPVIETGWEMPLLIRAMVKGIKDDSILQQWEQISTELMIQENLEKTTLINALDGVRDQWIHKNLEEWLDLHEFYEGVIPKLQKTLESSTYLYIITTKESRFVQQLLKNQRLDFPLSQIYGKEVKQPKYQTLQDLLNFHQEMAENLWFVEDLLNTLQKVQQQESLGGMGLFLADWGYNTPQVRSSIVPESGIKLLSLSQFSQDFSAWL